MKRDNVIKFPEYEFVQDVTLLEKNEIEYLLERMQDYVELFAYGAGFDEDIEIVQKITDKATVKAIVKSHIESTH